MTKLLEIYKCEECGNIVEITHAGDGELVCCGKPMKHFAENAVDASKEKHVPIIEKTAEGVKVSLPNHPMEEKHWIEWIEVIVDDGKQVLRKYLKPGDKAEAIFCLKEENIFAREYCNLHGLWRSN